MNVARSRHSEVIRRAAALFLPAAASMTILAGLVYGASQQVYRTSANDPQMQIARDAVIRLDSGISPQRVAGGRPVNLAASLDTHVSVYGAQGRLLASTARLSGSVPRPPSGVIIAVSGRDRVQHWLTWQPAPGVRVAAVISGWRHGAVLVGRSLAPTEERETDLEQLVGAIWIGGILFLAAISYLAARAWPAPVGAA